MTLATLSGIYSTSNQESEVLAPVGTDEAEFAKWAHYLQATGQSDLLGELTDDEAAALAQFRPE